MTSRLIIFLPGLLLLGASCLTETTYEPNLAHCVHNGGDEYCRAEHPDTPYCNSGVGMCSTGDPVGCLAEVSPECHAPCGEAGDLSCVDGSSSGSGSESGTDGSSEDTGETEGSSTSDGGMTTTTGDMPCMGDEDCTDAAAPFCDPAGECVDCGGLADGNAACAEADPGRPVCDAGVCVACTEQDPGACGGQTPVCGEDNLCQACTEHSECPGTACHLDGPQVGACFDAAEVVMASSTAQLQAAFAGVAAGDDVVIVLTGTDYSGAAIDFTANAEVAIIGDGSQLISGNASGAFVGVGGPAVLYLAGLTLAGNVTGDGLACSGTSVWLDDSEVRNNAQAGMDISGGCAAHLRRSVVRANSSGGIVAVGSSVVLLSSAVGENLDSGSIPGIQITDGELRSRYSSIVGNSAAMGTVDNIRCLGTPTIDVRNSIVVAFGNASISGCSNMGWANNALDTMALDSVNSPVSYNAGWFDPAEGDYHLTTAGETDLADLANWQPGDPPTDFDGQPIPTDMPSFPGYDQP